MKIVHNHYCEGHLNGNFYYSAYSGDGDTVGEGTASGKNPVSVNLIYQGIQNPP